MIFDTGAEGRLLFQAGATQQHDFRRSRLRQLQKRDCGNSTRATRGDDHRVGINLVSRSAGFRLRRLQHQPFTRSRQADFSFRTALEQFFDDSRGDLGWGALGYFNVDGFYTSFGPF